MVWFWLAFSSLWWLLACLGIPLFRVRWILLNRRWWAVLFGWWSRDLLSWHMVPRYHQPLFWWGFLSLRILLYGYCIKDCCIFLKIPLLRLSSLKVSTKWSTNLIVIMISFTYFSLNTTNSVRLLIVFVIKYSNKSTSKIKNSERSLKLLNRND